MSKTPSPSHHLHFEGKDALQHLKDARQRGALASSERHGIEPSGYLSAATDSAKETAFLLLSLSLIFASLLQHHLIALSILMVGWLIWKTGRSALLGWSRLERLHRLIEQERWEIEHHREGEKEELTAMYQQKGLKGKLLEQVIDILMADDNRLLQVMLEEELGLTLESYEHPLRQATGAATGVIIAYIAYLVGFLIMGFWGAAALISLLFAGMTLNMAKRQDNQLAKAVVWNIAVLGLGLGSIYYMAQFVNFLMGA